MEKQVAMKVNFIVYKMGAEGWEVKYSFADDLDILPLIGSSVTLREDREDLGAVNESLIPLFGQVGKFWVTSIDLVTTLKPKNIKSDGTIIQGFSRSYFEIHCKPQGSRINFGKLLQQKTHEKSKKILAIFNQWAGNFLWGYR